MGLRTLDVAVRSHLEEQELALCVGDDCAAVARRAMQPAPVSGAAGGAPACWRGFGCSGQSEENRKVHADGALRACRYLDKLLYNQVYPQNTLICSLRLLIFRSHCGWELGDGILMGI